MPASNHWLDVPTRESKPRNRGLTHVIDKGLNLRDIEGLFDTAGQFVDIVKLGWGTSYVTNNLEKKIALYRSFETPVVCAARCSRSSTRAAGWTSSNAGSATSASRTSRSRTERSRSRASASSS